MHINRLRLTGFKSFVEPTDLLIETGLTGVVGPNGCGKSNLLEALRWVMGETSYKSMRASAMEDVIFSGTAGRPARNVAEVTIYLDNSKRTAPAEFNDADDIEVTRRIEREAGSAYRLNGREVRARDVRVLFEDAASGARSPALVRQGQIGDIVNARPDQRRRILEDAAGIAGLHSRRHDAELRLKAADNNLLRVNDLLGQMTTRIDSLKRQARQARRYADLSGQMRALEALTLYLKWRAAQDEVSAEELRLGEIQSELAAQLSREAALIKRDADLSEAREAQRLAEAERAAALTRLTLARDNLDRDLERANQRIAELTEQTDRISSDLAREETAIGEAKARIAELTAEAQDLQNQGSTAQQTSEQLAATLTQATNELQSAEQALQALVRKADEETAAVRMAETRLTDREAAAKRSTERCTRLKDELQALDTGKPDEAALKGAETAHAEASQAATAAASAVEAARSQLETADAAAQEASRTGNEAHLAFKTLKAERDTLQKLLVPHDESGRAGVLEQVQINAGFERALAAALGDDLNLPANLDAPAHWRRVNSEVADPQLPPGTEALLGVIAAPPELARRLAQIGLVETAEKALALLPQLKPGQRLVTRQGDLFRWDGLIALAEAEPPAARRLRERNRLKALEVEVTKAEHQANVAIAAAQTAGQARQKAREDLRTAEQQLRAANAAESAARRDVSGRQQASQAHAARTEAARNALADAQIENADLTTQVSDLRTALAALPRTDHGPAIATARETANATRDRASSAQAALAAHKREIELRADRLTSLQADLKRWQERLSGAEKQLAALKERRTHLAKEGEKAKDEPDRITKQRSTIAAEVEQAEKQRQTAADALAEADSAAREAASALRALQGEMSKAREAKARIEAHLETARTRRTELAQTIQVNFEVRPEGCLRIAGIDDPAKLPAASDAEAKLAKLRAERERLGGVNLQASEDLEQAESEHATLDRERADIEEAIAKLRASIAKLNREARRRLVDAFQTVNAHFISLFETLFGGGEAHLELIESDDPLEGGLEIIAKPPGKKPVTLSLLSGGEQTLTALSLIFAVFLTNPSPICVLDEVDAPLDDANVDRFCNMMERMARETETRFLVITHHPMTMARMNRLFGVTMAERGVSQLVSVDLETAESYRDAS